MQIQNKLKSYVSSHMERWGLPVPPLKGRAVLSSYLHILSPGPAVAATFLHIVLSAMVINWFTQSSLCTCAFHSGILSPCLLPRYLPEVCCASLKSLPLSQYGVRNKVSPVVYRFTGKHLKLPRSLLEAFNYLQMTIISQHWLITSFPPVTCLFLLIPWVL